MRFNLKHWFILLVVTELFVGGLLYPTIVKPDLPNDDYVVLMKMFLIVLPALVSIIMIAFDQLFASCERCWARDEIKLKTAKSEFEKTALKVLEATDGRTIVFTKDFIRIYSKDSKKSMDILCDNIRFFYEKMKELGI